MLVVGDVDEGVKLKGICENTSVYVWKKNRVDRRIRDEVMRTSEDRAICIK